MIDEVGIMLVEVVYVNVYGMVIYVNDFGEVYVI